MHPFAVLVTIAALTQSPAGADSASADTALGRFEGSGDSHRRYRDDRIWDRRLTIRELENAALHAPRDVPTLKRLAEAYYNAGFMHLARETYTRVLALDRSDADAQFGLGRICEREWLDTLAPGTMTEAEQHFAAAVHARPGFCEAWVALGVVRFERRDLPGASEAVASALAISPGSLEAQLAGAYLAYRNGAVERADSLFSIAIPGCPAGIAARYDDITPLLTEIEQRDFEDLDPAGKIEYKRRFWSRNDPDLTTPQNEARLEYWSRLSHALLLIGDPWSPHWSGRTDLYSRYGRLVQMQSESAYKPQPTEMPRVAWGDVPVDPTPEALQSLGQATVADGRAIFSPLPPGAHELPLASLISRFEGPRGARLDVRVETPGSLVDSLFADCVAIDAGDREVARNTRALSPSECDPTRLLAGDFTFELPPGRYRLACAVRDASGGRGVAQAEREVTPPTSELSTSDLVLVCGPLDATRSQSPVTFSPNMRASVGTKKPLIAYFEIYHLRTDASGGNLCEYEYTVRDLGKGASGAKRSHRHSRAAPRLSFRRTEEGVGPLRRQFINVPTASLPAGHYRLTISVRDELAGTKTEQWVDFVKEQVEK